MTSHDRCVLLMVCRHGQQFELTGTHDIDTGEPDIFMVIVTLLCLLAVGWVEEVKSGGREVKVVPRVLFEGWSMADFMDIFADLAKMESLGDYIGRQLKVRVSVLLSSMRCFCVCVCVLL